MQTRPHQSATAVVVSVQFAEDKARHAQARASESQTARNQVETAQKIALDNAENPADPANSLRCHHMARSSVMLFSRAADEAENVTRLADVRTASPNEVTRNFLRCIVTLTYVTVILT